jgi:hypothetical protein
MRQNSEKMLKIAGQKGQVTWRRIVISKYYRASDDIHLDWCFSTDSLFGQHAISKQFRMLVELNPLNNPKGNIQSLILPHLCGIGRKFWQTFIKGCPHVVFIANTMQVT